MPGAAEITGPSLARLYLTHRFTLEQTSESAIHAPYQTFAHLKISPAREFPGYRRRYHVIPLEVSKISRYLRRPVALAQS